MSPPEQIGVNMQLSKFAVAVCVLYSVALGSVWSEPQRILFGKASGIALDTQGVLWCVAYPEGLYKYHNETSTWQLEIDVLPFGGTPCFDKDNILWLVQDLWVGDSIRYVRYDGESWSEEEHALGGSHITADSSNGVWVGGTTSAFGYKAVVYNRYCNGVWGELRVLTNTSEAIENVISSITTDAYGRVWIGWIGIEDLWDTVFHYIEAAYWDGNDWSEEMTIAVRGPEVQKYCAFLRLAPDREGGMWAVWNYERAYGDSVAVEASYWDGMEWSFPDTIAVAGNFYQARLPNNNIAVDSDGNAWAVWRQALVEQDSCGDIYYSVNQGQGWSEPAPVNEHPAVDGSASIAVDGEGRIWCIWGSTREGKHGVYASYATGVGVTERDFIQPPKSTIESILPNPFKSSTTISYSVAGRLGSRENQFVELKIFDVTGRQVKALVSDKQSPAHYEIIWNGQDNEGLRCASGIYFIRMNSESFSANERLILLR